MYRNLEGGSLNILVSNLGELSSGFTAVLWDRYIGALARSLLCTLFKDIGRSPFNLRLLPLIFWSSVHAFLLDLLNTNPSTVSIHFFRSECI